jgi:hypothetical protein
VQELNAALIEHMKTHLRENVWTCESIARTMDLRHVINLSGIDALHGMDPLRHRKNGDTHRNTNYVLWHSGSIKSCIRDTEKEMKEKIG